MAVLFNNEKLVKNPMVSVFCNTYNQESYIRHCLDSLLAQKTNFEFELLITDDASTDGTSEIVRMYAEKYPQVIVAVLHEENQYSKGKNQNIDFLFPRARGKYIAFCEGDDFWIDDHKLQNQFDAMEKTPSASWCVHSSVNVKADTEEHISILARYDSDTILHFPETDQYIQLAATASFFVKYDIYKMYATAPVCNVSCHGDFRMSRFFSLCGDTIYLAKPMSAYRVLAKGSINLQIASNHNWRDVIEKNTQDRIAFLRALNEWSSGTYAREIESEIQDMEYYGAIDLKDWHKLVKTWPDRFRHEPFGTKIKVALFSQFPGAYDCIRHFKLACSGRLA